LDRVAAESIRGGKMNRNAIVRASKSRGKLVTIPEWGGVKVKLRPMSVQRVQDFRAEVNTAEKSEDPDRAIGRVMAIGFMSIVADPSTGDLEWDLDNPEDLAEVMSLDGDVVSRVINQSFSGNVEETKKKYKPATQSPTSGRSPAA